MCSEKPKVGDHFVIRDGAWPACEWPCTSGTLTGIVDSETFAAEMDDYEATAVSTWEIEVIR